MANGETRPSKMTGMAKSSTAPTSELAKILTEMSANPVTDQFRIPWQIEGNDANRNTNDGGYGTKKAFVRIAVG